jgi:hypothetical protein
MLYTAAAFDFAIEKERKRKKGKEKKKRKREKEKRKNKKKKKKVRGQPGNRKMHINVFIVRIPLVEQLFLGQQMDDDMFKLYMHLAANDNERDIFT